MAIDMYLKVDGATGESQDANHKGWIDISTFLWGALQVGTMSSGGGGGAGKASFHDLSVIATLDTATPALLKHCASGKHLGEVKLSFCKAGGSQIEYSTIVLKDVIVTSVEQASGSGDGLVHLTYAFQSTQVEHHYWVQLKDGVRGAESQFGWHIKENRATA
jgi:type VI secretion system secreted protein Hcp